MQRLGGWTRRSHHLLTPLLALSFSSPSSFIRIGRSSATAAAFMSSNTGSGNGSGNNNCSDILDLRILKDPIDSTQDETKRILADNDDNANDNDDNKILAVLAHQQENGRGTQGRKWEGRSGNVYLTVAVPMALIPVTITLLPLQIGVIIAQTLEEFMNAKTDNATTTDKTKATVNVKWPNDVLVNQQKIAGVLIENWLDPKNTHQVWFLIGIGVNVAYAPKLPPEVRPAICLQDIVTAGDDDETTESSLLPESTAQDLGTNLVNSLVGWINTNSNDDSPTTKAQLEEQLLQEWKSYTQFQQIYTIRETGEKVVTLDIHRDGQLKVRGANGKERLLAAEYLH